MMRSFPRQIVATLIVVGGIAAYPLLRWYSREVITAALAGTALATLNVLLGYAALEYSRGKSTQTFFKVVLGGMGIRIILLLVLLELSLLVFAMDTIALIWSLGLFYIIFLIEEVLYIQQSVEEKQQGTVKPTSP